jgi:ubiquinone/menaquinone biosynthesis C-methylase UbiE
MNPIKEIKRQLKGKNLEEINEGIVGDYSKKGRYKEAVNISEGLTLDETKLVMNYFKNRKAKILVLGCGGGREAFALKKLGYNVVGVDITPKLINFARHYSERNKIPLKFYVRDITNLDLFKENRFDYVVMFKSVIGHIKDRAQVFREIRRILKKQGILIFTTYYKYANLKRALSLSLLNILKFFRNIFSKHKLEYNSWIYLNHCYVHMPSLKETKLELKRANLKLLKNYFSKKMRYMFFVAIREEK